MERTTFLPGADPAGTSEERLEAMRREHATVASQRLHAGVVVGARAGQVP